MNWTKTPTRAGFWAWRYGPDSVGCSVYGLSDHDGKLWAFDGGEFGPCDEWGGEWAELVTAEEAQADAAAMREALEHAHTAINYAVTAGFEDTIKTIVNAALSVNAGRELLGELKRLRTELAEMTTIAEKARTRELEQLDELSTLRTDLAKAQSQCAELRSEVQRAWREGFDSGKRLPSFKAQEYTNSRARKVATGKAVT